MRALRHLPGRRGGRCLALLLRDADPESGIGQVTVQIMSAERERAPQIAAQLRRLATVHNDFRHQVRSFAGSEVLDYEQQTLLRFHPRPALSADDLVLPAATVQAVRRQVVETARRKDRLLAAGQHLERGLMLHGPPGVTGTEGLRVAAGDLDDALAELLSTRNTMTRVLLGVAETRSGS